MSTNGRNFLNTNLVIYNRHHTKKPSNSPFKIKTEEKTILQEVFFRDVLFLPTFYKTNKIKLSTY